MLGRTRPRDSQVVGNDFGYSNYSQAQKEKAFEEEFGGHKELTIVEWSDRVYICFGGDHKEAYKNFYSAAEIRRIEEQQNDDF